MRSLSLSLSLLAGVSSVLGAGQIPDVDGVIGGVPSAEAKSAAQPNKEIQRAAGQLRGVVENSGICGE